MASQLNTRGILIMILAMGAFALADGLVKLAASFASPAQVLFFLMGGSLVSFAAMALAKRERLLDSRMFHPILLLRYLAEIAGMIGMVLALTYVPISTVGAITQAAPILVALGAVVFLEEKVSWRRWSAITIGFVGVLLVIQPGNRGFDVSVLWAVLAMVGLAVRDFTTRLTPTDMASSSLATYTMIAAIPVSLLWVWLNGEPLIPVHTDWLIILPMIVLGSLGYLLLIASLRMAEVSVVTLFRYSRILFLLALGVLAFDERPGFLTLLGAALIVVSGVYMMFRESQVKGDLIAQ